MPDITKCKNDKCVKHSQCWRFTAPDSPIQQWNSYFDPKNNEYDEFECDYYIGIPSFDKYLHKK